jgi:phage tail-like protein
MPVTETVADPPPAASARQYLRAGLPAIYRDDKFTMRFVGGFELVLDPIVALLDSLHAHFDVDLAPPHVVTLIQRWLGLEVPAVLDPDPRANEQIHRTLARNATALTRLRGTRTGLERLLRLAFPGLDISVEDSGTATTAAEPREAPDAPAPSFTVVTGVADVPPEVQTVLRRLVQGSTPVHVQGWLKVGPDGEAVAL